MNKKEQIAEILSQYAEQYVDSVLNAPPRKDRLTRDRAADQVLALDNWVSVEDRLPELEQPVLITNGDTIFSSTYDDADFRYDYAGDTTHWQPLPQLPVKDR